MSGNGASQSNPQPPAAHLQPKGRRWQRVGELRPSQFLFSYGIGAIVDLPYLSVLVLGLEEWESTLPYGRPGGVEVIHEERLLQSVRAVLGPQVERLQALPRAPEDEGPPNPFDTSALVGIPVTSFPRWLLCPACRTLASLSSNLFALRTDPFHPDRARYVHSHCPRRPKPPTVLPARFLLACRNGHLDDFPWHYYLHQGKSCPYPRFKLIEIGVSGEVTDIQVRCESCGAQKPMSDAFGQEAARYLPPCPGRHPHLRQREDCSEQPRAILLGASNSWFSLRLSTLAVPEAQDPLEQLVIQHWALLSKATSEQEVALLRRIGQLAGPFEPYSDGQIWAVVAQRLRAQEAEEAGQEASGRHSRPFLLKVPEWRILSQPQSAPDTDDFRLKPVAVPEGYAGILERVVLVERLREVQAMIGFTRIEAPDELLDLGAAGPQSKPQRVSLSRRRPRWVPAIEVRGEGIFLQLCEEPLRAWEERLAPTLYSADFLKAHSDWRRRHGLAAEPLTFPGLRYVLLHSLAHALIRQLTLECGYGAASIRERVYALGPEEENGPMAGILLYTAAPDSEGTLGGLVSLGEPQQLGRHLRAALEQMQVCTSDPLCAEHTALGDGSLHQAACHACLFLPETSCERGNKYLDRSLLVPTIVPERAQLAFFGDLLQQRLPEQGQP
ncbi:DrmB family protein [Thermogemmatispora sp.]|uniref:DrmB family protein n=1 Tax=Thermogemmatispora sp. TaxID=1968838 RepID=UPI0035E40B40